MVKSSKKFLTDYPITGNEELKLVEIKLLSWDRDKYVLLEYNGVVDEIKSGYIYSGVREDGSYIFRSLKDLMRLPINIKSKTPTELEVAREYKSRVNTTRSYSIWNDKDKVSTNHKSLDSVIKSVTKLLMKNPNTSIDVTLQIESKSYSSMNFFSITELYLDDTPSSKPNRVGNLSRKNYQKLSKLLNKLMVGNAHSTTC